MADEMAFRKLVAYNKSRDLVIRVYELIKRFPKEDQYALCDQLRRAVVSVPSNIAEGMGRLSMKDRAHFLEIAFGSLLETNCQLDVANKLGYITEAELEFIDKECRELARVLSGLRTSLLKEESGK